MAAVGAVKVPDERGDYVEAFRVDVSAAAWPILVPAAILTTVGAMLICTSFVVRGALMHRPELTYVGALCMLVGPSLAVIGMRRLLANDDDYVAALQRGLLVRLAGSETFVPWGAIAAIRRDPATDALCVDRSDGEPLVLTYTFRLPNEALAARLDELRRKGSFNLLP